MRLAQPYILLVAFSVFAIAGSQRTSLDQFINEYRALRNGLFKFIGRSDTDASYLWNVRRRKVQKPVDKNVKFMCDVNGPGRRSDQPPTTVHRLRPGDIDIVAAIGDSLTAGNGAMARNIMQVFIENKGVSWSIGGQANWRKFLTLPNILKEFNPRLYGYSLSDGLSTDKSSRFNVAEIGAMSRDIPHEAKVLVKRITGDRRVNNTAHWKLVTILIGPNDFCLDFCHLKNPDKSSKSHKQELLLTLRTLRDNLPRTLVNLVTPPSMKILYELKGVPSECEATHHFECPCIFGFRYDKVRLRYFRIIEKWQEITEQIANLEEFNRDDFTVVNQPFLRNLIFPRKPNGLNDFTYMSTDCFHLSQKGYARAANAVWNNMLEPVGNKSANWSKEFGVFRCPTEEHPFIRTRMN